MGLQAILLVSVGFDPPTLAVLRNFDASQCTELEWEAVVRLHETRGATFFACHSWIRRAALVPLGPEARQQPSCQIPSRKYVL
jgi:hypothetical protein